MQPAAFSFSNYKFRKAEINLDNIKSEKLDIRFFPSGQFDAQKSEFQLLLDFYAYNDNIEESIVKVSCSASFVFDEKIEFDKIPEYFYANSIAIVFPYIRAFVSTITLQANAEPIVLPTLHLVELGDVLLKNTQEIR